MQQETSGQLRESAASYREALGTSEMVAALRTEFDSAAATNRAALDAAITMIQAASDVVSDMKASSKEYADALGIMLKKTEEAMRTITDVVGQWSSESSTRSDRLTEQLPEIEAKPGPPPSS